MLSATTFNDFDGDHKTDLVTYQESTGGWSILLSGQGFNHSRGTGFIWGGPHQVSVGGIDFDGDHKSDPTVYDTVSGTFSILLSSHNFNTAQGVGIVWGGPGQVPVGGMDVDVDGDGKSDLTVYQASSGSWSILLSSHNDNRAQGVSYKWGGGNQVPVGGIDYDGDGKTDLAVYLPTTGIWSILLSSHNFNTAQGVGIQWGGSGQVAMGNMDVDGDGKSDLAVYQQSTGIWSFLLSSHNNNPKLGMSIQWGGPDQIPVGSIDFDGDHKTDLATYRPSDGVWSLHNTATGATWMVQWGGSNQVPISNSSTIVIPTVGTMTTKNPRITLMSGSTTYSISNSPAQAELTYGGTAPTMSDHGDVRFQTSGTTSAVTTPMVPFSIGAMTWQTGADPTPIPRPPEFGTTASVTIAFQFGNGPVTDLKMNFSIFRATTILPFRSTISTNAQQFQVIGPNGKPATLFILGFRQASQPITRDVQQNDGVTGTYQIIAELL